MLLTQHDATRDDYMMLQLNCSTAQLLYVDDGTLYRRRRCSRAARSLHCIRANSKLAIYIILCPPTTRHCTTSVLLYCWRVAATRTGRFRKISRPVFPGTSNVYFLELGGATSIKFGEEKGRLRFQCGFRF